MSTHNTERRALLRRRTLLGGQIAFNAEQSTISCTVRNLSEGGARLTTQSPLGIPDEFILHFESRPKRPARVVWRGVTELGVSFAPLQ